MFDFLKKNKRAENTPSKQEDGFVRSFAAAEVDRILSPWRWDNGYSNVDIGTQLAIIRARSREMAKNSAHFKRYLDLFVANVVGEGFRFKSTAAKSISDFSVDDKSARFIENHWWRWSTVPARCDETGRKSLVSILQLCAENWARDGEFFIHLNRNAQNIYGLSLRVIRPDACDETINGTHNGHIIRNGVEVDADTLKPVAFWFNTEKEDPAAIRINRRPRIRIPAHDIIHGFTQHDECQTRGIPLGHAILAKLKMLDEYDRAELAAARDEANTLGAFHAPAGREGEIGTWTNDAKNSVRTMESKPGQKLILPQGWTYDSHTPQHPNREVTAFKNSMLRDIASGLSLEYACFANDWAGVSYSSVRQGTIAERDMWMMLQGRFIEQCLDRIFSAWLESILALNVSSGLPHTEYNLLYDHEFRGRRWSWVDPMKDVNAAAIAVQHGWKTDEQVAADYGCDISDNLAEQSRVKKLRESLGISTAPATPAEPENDDGEEDDEEALNTSKETTDEKPKAKSGVSGSRVRGGNAKRRRK